MRLLQIRTRGNAGLVEGLSFPQNQIDNPTPADKRPRLAAVEKEVTRMGNVKASSTLVNHYAMCAAYRRSHDQMRGPPSGQLGIDD